MMIPRQSYSFSGTVVTFYFFFLVSFILHTYLASPTPPYCRHDQRDALMEFKHEFLVNKSNPIEFHMSSWNKSSDCCSWDGVTCDAKSGTVILLDLFGLNNSLKPNSALFKLQYLQNLSLSNFSGEIPSSLGNLSHLVELQLYGNNFVGQIPFSIGNLTQLRTLRLNDNNLSGKIPVSFANLTKLIMLDLSYNNFEYELPPDMIRLHDLEYFYARQNSFSGSFPTFLFMIPSLQSLHLRENQFKGPIDFGNTSSFSKLESLVIDHNKFDGPIPESISQFLNLSVLDLGYNNFIGPIPKSISKLVSLSFLDLSNNKLEGIVPGSFWRIYELKLSHNSFSSLEKPLEIYDRVPMRVLRLDSNSLPGPFPPWICNFNKTLQILDLSNNRFSGGIPQCLSDFTIFLQVLSLRNNNFNGTLPDMFVNAAELKVLDISRNRLEGKLPKSLLNCQAMELLNVESNNFKDKFPSWLGSLSSLNVLILRSNQFYGPLYQQNVSIGFQNIKLIDVSHNGFTGTLPPFYFSNWRKMTTLNEEDDDGSTYMEDVVHSSDSYSYSMEMVHKGVYREFERIRKDFIAIDFSENKFSGKIPESIGLLKELILLNLSGNAFTSNIPQSLANLTNLEALDLSKNQLVGKIPQDLGILAFLSTINFSHNNLEGPVPQGTQFQRQNCSSFMDNPRLIGLKEICEKAHVLNPILQEPDEVLEQEEQVINWIAAGIAYGPGVFCGLVIGYIFFSHKNEWLMEKIRRNKSIVVKIR